MIKALAEDMTGARVGRAAQSDFNSYPYEMYGHPATTPGNWVKGSSFALHLPGMTAQRRTEIFKDYEKEIIWD
jgi:ribosome recycling factor